MSFRTLGRQTQTNQPVRLQKQTRRVIDLTLDLGEGCFPRFAEVTPINRRILLAASRSVALPRDPLFDLVVNPLISAGLTLNKVSFQ